MTRLTADLTNSLQNKLGDWNDRSIHLRSRLSHIIRRQQRRYTAYFQFPVDGDLENLRLDEPLPTPSEQLDLLILALGDNQPSPAESARIPADALSAAIGVAINRQFLNAGLDWLLEQSTTKTLVERRREDEA